MESTEKKPKWTYEKVEWLRNDLLSLLYFCSSNKNVSVEECLVASSACVSLRHILSKLQASGLPHKEEGNEGIY